ncbi:hypothetical protein [uncultured Dokdonia sp.]|uniref:hypothetical protein n=1 Tax=uncultured Dokdonia sp. TaxID=575653 RepID=UPI002625D787|nr:hypothetical protein [uncultured Dokdonia sp.]
MNRVSKIASELNVCVEKVISELIKEFGKKYQNNTKLLNDEIDFLFKIFKKHFDNKKRANEIRSNRLCNVDRSFQFSEKEVSIYTNEFKKHSKLLIDIKLLESKADRFENLESSEIGAILQIKFEGLENIQNEIKLQRFKKTNILPNTGKEKYKKPNPIRKSGVTIISKNHLSVPDDNPWSGVLGSDEEEHTAYWNTH